VIAGIVLAAGRSSRLGRPKQLLDVHGQPLIRRTVARAVASALDDILVVIGHEAEAVRAALDGLPVRIVANPDAERGQSTSLRAGLAALSPQTEAVIFLLGDQPTVDPATIEALIAAWRSTRAPVVAPQYSDGLGNPIVFNREVFSELASLRGDVGARAVVRAREAAGDLLAVPMAGAAPRDVDTEEDYAALLAAWPTMSPSHTRSNDQAVSASQCS
jgi:molybdenum cofactor cytidylyltransferase